jgi:hypothetical protein
MSHHEFLSPIEKEQEYKDCLNCGKRKSMVCLTCDYCYECHPIIEAIEEKPTKVPFTLSKLDDIEEPLS